MQSLIVTDYKQPSLPTPATPTGYNLPATATFEDWIADGEKLKLIDKWKNFAIGDWLLAGQNKFGEACYSIIDDSWGDYNKLTKLVWVARNVPPQNRNMWLTWTHHHHVASIENKRVQAEWLERAVRESMSSNELRDAIRASQQPAQLPPVIPHTDGHIPLDDDGDDVPFSFGRNGSDGDSKNEYGTAEWVAERSKDAPSPGAVSEWWQNEKPRPHVANNSGNNEWYTPEHYTTAARAVMGEITLDPASSELANTKVKAAHIYTADDDGLSMPWFGKVWLNPPYAAGLVDKFASKLVGEYESGEVDEAIVLVNNATETAWFSSLVSVASAICFPSQRVRFWSPSGEPGAPLQGQAVVYVGENAGSFVDHFSQIGWCAWVA